MKDEVTPSDRMKEHYTRTLVLNLCVASVYLLSDCDEWKAEDLSLSFLTDDPGWSCWEGPYFLGDDSFVDEWDTPIELDYASASSCVHISSAGVDKRFETEDEIVAKMCLGDSAPVLVQ